MFLCVEVIKSARYQNFLIKTICEVYLPEPSGAPRNWAQNAASFISVYADGFPDVFP